MRVRGAADPAMKKLFAKITGPPPPQRPTPVPPRLPASASAPLPAPPDQALKLNLPNLFEFQDSETRAKPSAKCPSAADEDSGLSRGTLLLVESDEEIQRLLSRLLKHEGYRLLTASCLAEARALVEGERADYVLARRQCVPVNPKTEQILRDLQNKTRVRIVDDFSELILGQIIDYESATHAWLTLTNLLMSLMEGSQTGVRGHAHNVAKYCRLVGQRLGLERRDLDTVTLAGYLHDLGAVANAQQLGAPLHRQDEAAAAAIRASLELLACLESPYEIADVLRAAGPTATAETSPRLHKLAHILRVADAYDSLRRTSGQSTDDLLFEELRRLPATTFDPHVLETFIHLRKNEQRISAMDLFWANVLLVDPHPEDQQLLRLRLENDDLHVHTAASVEEALNQLRKQPITVVLSEYDLNGRGDGLELLRTLRADPQLRQVVFVFHAVAQTDRVKQALELGAEDWFDKPHNVEIIAMKLQRIITRHQQTAAAGNGVHGNLRELGLIEMVQILCTGNRSVQILLDNGKHTGEIVLQNGRITAARAGELSGELAVFQLLNWTSGTFRILPLRQPGPVAIRASTDNLLLQWCHLQDERALRDR
jgi:response regulator RpfG family c-di-GMP phosphodiesterase